METFSALLAICAGNSPVPGEFPTQRPVRRSFDVYFDLRPNKRLSKQSWGWWFETQSRPLWRHRNEWLCKDYMPLRLSSLYVCYSRVYVCSCGPWWTSNKSYCSRIEISIIIYNAIVYIYLGYQYTLCVLYYAHRTLFQQKPSCVRF